MSFFIFLAAAFIAGYVLSYFFHAQTASDVTEAENVITAAKSAETTIKNDLSKL